MKCTWLICVLVACYSSHAVPDGGSIDGAVDASNIPDAPTSATIVHSFDGQIGAGLAACTAMGGHCDRPEMNAAANGSQVVQVSSIGVTVYSYSGTLLAATPLSMFIANAGLQTTVAKAIEPHVVYDEFIQRWIITASCAFDCLMVSASSDANGAWSGVYIDNDGSDPSIHLGYDINGVYLSEVQSGGTNPDASVAGFASVYFAIPSSEMRWVGAFAPVHKNRVANMPLDGMPATDQSPNKQPTDHAFFVAKTCNGNCQNASAYSFHWLVNTVTWSGSVASYSADQIIKTAVGSTQDQWLYNTPIAAVAQAGSTTTIRPIEGHRVMNVSQTGSHLYTTLGSGPCTSGCGAQGSDANDLFFWVDLDCSASACVVAQTGKVSDPNDHLVFATIGATSSGNVAIVAASVGATIDPSIVLWTRATTDAPSTLAGPSTVVAGTQPDTCIANPVSFASAVGISTVRDPLDPTKLWTTHQYSNSSSPCVWATRVIELAP